MSLKHGLDPISDGGQAIGEGFVFLGLFDLARFVTTEAKRRLFVRRDEIALTCDHPGATIRLSAAVVSLQGGHGITMIRSMTRNPGWRLEIRSASASLSYEQY